MDSKFRSITLMPSIYHDSNEMDPIVLEGEESQILAECEKGVQSFDPDFIISGNGDAFVFPYLYSKAQNHRVSFNLNRYPDSYRLVQSTRSGGRTYFSLRQDHVHDQLHRGSTEEYTLMVRTLSSTINAGSKGYSRLQGFLGCRSTLHPVLPLANH